MAHGEEAAGAPSRTLGFGRRRAARRRGAEAGGGVTGAEKNTSFSGRVYYVLINRFSFRRHLSSSYVIIMVLFKDLFGILRRQ